MKRYYIALIIILLVFFGYAVVKKSEVLGSAQGRIDSYSADLMPRDCMGDNLEDCIPPSSMGPYGGKIFFVSKIKYDSFDWRQSFDTLVESGSNLEVNGSYSINLKPGEYVVLSRDYPTINSGGYHDEYIASRIINISPGKITKQDIVMAAIVS